ncbi:MAG TPA: non-homologous end-joining DNA ligase [Methylomirabilota bacterium]|nr:non-homologous end-joining DNA ligase [Methylomirabilota bacterium]
MARPQPTRDYHPATRTRVGTPGRGAVRVEIPRDADDAEVAVGDRTVKLTNLRKVFWDREGLTKGDLLRYYAEMAPVLLPHIRDRAMVMKRYPNGAAGEFFFMKRAPRSRPAWIETCAIEHSSGSVIDFPVINDLAALLWVINLGCIDLNEWYARCDDVDRPDYLHFDLDPGEEVEWPQVVETAQAVNETLRGLGMPTHVKTTGSRGVHVYVPIVRGPTQKVVWTAAKTIALDVARRHPRLATAVYRKDARPRDRVHVDFNQNAWGRTLASVYSVRPRPRATVSTPVTWDELAGGVTIEDFRIDNVPARVRRRGDLWAPVAPGPRRGRFDLAAIAG